MVKVTLNGHTDNSHHSIYYTTPSGESGSLSTAGTYELPYGTNLSFTVWVNKMSGYSVNINLNNELVASDRCQDSLDKADASYSLTLTNETVVDLRSSYDFYGVDIFEIPEGGKLITVTGYGLEYFIGVCHNDMCYYEPTKFVAYVGDTIRAYTTECWNRQELWLNGVMLEGGYGENDISYDYTVVSDAIIDLYQTQENYQGSEKRARIGIIRITEIPERNVTVTLPNGTYYAPVKAYAACNIDTIAGVVVNGNEYTVPAGTTIQVEAGPDTSYDGFARIYVNGTEVAYQRAGAVYYDFLVIKNTTTSYEITSDGQSFIYITES